MRKNSENSVVLVLFFVEGIMRPKRYPYSFSGFELVDISTIYAWEKPMYKLVTYRNKATGEIRSETIKL